MKRGVKREIEVKLRVGDAAAMRRRLRRMGARAVRRVHEMNTLLDTPQGTMRKRGRLMRLREETVLGEGLGLPRGKEKARAVRRSFASLRMKAGRTRYVLTFKGLVEKERQQNLPSTRPAVRDARDVSYMGGGQAGKPVLRKTAERRRYERYKVREEAEYIVGDARAVWAVAGPAGMRPSFRYEKFRTSYRVPGAGGVHVEFDETPAGFFLELEGSRRGIDRMARRLGYGPGDYIVCSYAALHFEECRRRGVRAGDMVFRPPKK